MFTFYPLPHDEAVARIAGLPLMQRQMFDELLPELKAYAFTITGLDGFDQLAKARDLIAAVPAGTATWDKAKKEIAAELADNLTGKAAVRRAELLLRTHVFRSYAVSRYRTLIQQVDVFPFWQYKTVGDHRVRPSHAALNNKVFPAGHEIWQRIFPPWDWGCRCLVVPLTQRTAETYREADKLAAPETQRVYDGNVLDAIQTGGRLPSGHALDHAPTWAASPWSETGTVQHTWQLIQDRYSNEPAILAAFTDWAGKTKIEGLKITVSEWLSGGPASLPPPRRKRAAKAVVETAASIAKQVQALATLRGSNTTIDLAGMDTTQAKAVSNAMTAHLNEFPEAMKELAFFGTNAGQSAWIRATHLAALRAKADAYYAGWTDAEALKTRWINRQLRRLMSSSPKALAFHSHRPRARGENRLVFNKAMLKPDAARLARWQRAVDSGWWPSNLRSVDPTKMITDHELGHAMDAALAVRHDVEIQKLWAAHKKLSFDGQRDALSQYGSSEIAEMIAEGWTEYRNAPNPRPLALAIGRRIEELYTSKFPPTV